MKDPVKVHPDSYYHVTPFGVYCSICQTPVGRAYTKITHKLLAKHALRKKHKNSSNVSYKKLSDLFNNYICNNFSTDHKQWLKTIQPQRIHACTCGMTFSRLDNLSRHIKTKQRNSTFEHHAVSNLPVVSTVCDRTIVLSNELYDTPFTSIQSTNDKWISTTAEDVRNMFEKYKNIDETLDPYLHLLKLLIVNINEENVIDVIISYVHAMGGHEYNNCKVNEISIDNEDEDGLYFFLEVCIKWLQYYSREHVNALNGNIRFRIQSFFDESVLMNHGFRVNFTMREKEQTLAKEIELIVRLSWKLYHQRRMNSELWNHFDSVMKHIKIIRMKNNNTVSMEVVQEMLKKLIVQQFFYFIFIEPQQNAYSLLFGVNIIIARLFKFNKETAKETKNTDDTAITMRSCAEFGSVIGTQIHIYRLAICSLLACSESNTSWDYILQHTTDSCLCHLMSPILNKVSSS